MFPKEIFKHVSFLYECIVSCPSHRSWDVLTLTIFGEEYKIWTSQYLLRGSGLHIWWVAANIWKKQLWTVDNGRFFILDVGCGTWVLKVIMYIRTYTLSCHLRCVLIKDVIYFKITIPKCDFGRLLGTQILFKSLSRVFISNACIIWQRIGQWKTDFWVIWQRCFSCS